MSLVNGDIAMNEEDLMKIAKKTRIATVNSSPMWQTQILWLLRLYRYLMQMAVQSIWGYRIMEIYLDLMARMLDGSI